MQKTSTEYILSEEVPTVLNSMNVIKTALSMGITPLKDLLVKDDLNKRNEFIDRYVHFMELLHKNGLSRILTEKDMYEEVKSLNWKILKADETEGEVDNFFYHTLNIYK